MMIFDTHCHLNHEDLYPSIEEIIQRAKNAKVEKFLVVGYDEKTSKLAVKIAKKYEFCYAAIGYHPTEIDGVNDKKLLELIELAKCDKVKAIGEIGLDYHWVKDQTQRDKQKDYFIKQINIANKLNLPITIHCRDAYEDCLEILKNNNVNKKGILHCYGGSVEMMEEFLRLGFYISLGGPVTFTNAKTPKAVAENCPLEKLLVETDSPYLTPHPFRGEKNEPKHVCLVVEEIARLKDISKKHVADVTYNNALKILNIDETQY